MADLRLDISAEDKASDALRKVANALDGVAEGQKKQTEATEKQSNSFLKQMAIWDGMKAGASALIAITKESLKLYAEQERADKQLSLSAGVLTEAFKSQADAIEKASGMDGIMVEKMQGLLLTFGVAPGEIKKTVDALLDYSARTGEDGVTATEKLLKSVESGRSGFKGLNLTMGDTSSQAERMTGYVDALGAKFGGSLAADSETLAGRTRIAGAAMEDMQKSFGAMVASMGVAAVGWAQGSGVLGNLSMVFKYWRDQLSGASAAGEAAEAANQKIRDVMDLVERSQAAVKEGERTQSIGWMASSVGAQNLATHQKNLAIYKAQLAELLEARDGAARKAAQQAAAQNEKDREAAARMTGEGSLLTTPDKKTTEAAKVAIAKDGQERTKIRMDLANDFNELNRKNDEARLKAAQARRDQEESEAEDLAKRMAADQAKAIEMAAREMEQAAAREAAFAKSAGEQMGNALLGGLTSALNQASTGGEVDIGAILSGLLGTAVTIALASNPATAAFAGAGGALASAGGMALSRAVQGTQKRHEGGWIEAPRYHSGAWVGADEQPAILQNGERVLSRSEVRGMGGPSGVDSAARGGAGASVTVQTFDGQTTRDFFERAGGRALLNAVRTGRGAPALLFGGG